MLPNILLLWNLLTIFLAVFLNIQHLVPHLIASQLLLHNLSNKFLLQRQYHLIHKLSILLLIYRMFKLILEFINTMSPQIHMLLSRRLISKLQPKQHHAHYYIQKQYTIKLFLFAILLMLQQEYLQFNFSLTQHHHKVFLYLFKIFSYIWINFIYLRILFSKWCTSVSYYNDISLCCLLILH